MNLLILAFFLILNGAISWWNAYAIGKSWDLTHDVSLLHKVTLWAGAVMTAAGFTWCYLVLVVLGMQAFYQTGLVYFPEELPEVVFNAGYLIVAIAAVTSGFVIWLQSVANAIRSGKAVDIGIALWNSYAQFSNTRSLLKHGGSAFKSVRDFMKDMAKDKNGFALLAFVFVLMAILLGGTMTAYALINKYREPELAQEVIQKYRKKDLV